MIGYQFSGENDSYYDDNWLLFELYFQIDGNASSRVDPLFLTWECLDFSRWFFDFPRLPTGSKIFNLENTFYFFKLKENSTKTKKNLRIQLDKSIVPFPIDSPNMIFDFHIGNSDCLEISDSFQQIVNQFPIRSMNKN
ncbi:MAG: hypothetical protein SH817_11595 [Leptospira sp.]|nr:hypothetical protein [Leptospira sp.]